MDFLGKYSLDMSNRYRPGFPILGNRNKGRQIFEANEFIKHTFPSHFGGMQRVDMNREGLVSIKRRDEYEGCIVIPLHNGPSWLVGLNIVRNLCEETGRRIIAHAPYDENTIMYYWRERKD